MNWKLITLLIIATCSFLACSESTYHSVSNVVDGDTIDVMRDDEEVRVRLLGVYTLDGDESGELAHCLPEGYMEEIKAMFLGREVKLVRDESQLDTDRYWRELRYVFDEDGRNLNKWLIEEGYGFEYTFDVPHMYQQEFLAAQEKAKLDTSGVWGAGCSVEEIESYLLDR